MKIRNKYDFKNFMEENKELIDYAKEVCEIESKCLYYDTKDLYFVDSSVMDDIVKNNKILKYMLTQNFHESNVILYIGNLTDKIYKFDSLTNVKYSFFNFSFTHNLKQPLQNYGLYNDNLHFIYKGVPESIFFMKLTQSYISIYHPYSGLIRRDPRKFTDITEEVGNYSKIKILQMIDEANILVERLIEIVCSHIANEKDKKAVKEKLSMLYSKSLIWENNKLTNKMELYIKSFFEGVEHIENLFDYYLDGTYYGKDLILSKEAKEVEIDNVLKQCSDNISREIINYIYDCLEPIKDNKENYTLSNDEKTDNENINKDKDEIKRKAVLEELFGSVERKEDKD